MFAQAHTDKRPCQQRHAHPEGKLVVANKGSLISKEETPVVISDDYILDVEEEKQTSGFDLKSALGIMQKISGNKLFAGKTMPFTLRASIALQAAVTTGVVNLNIPVADVAANTEFADLAALFDEFFVKKMRCHYQPVSRYAPEYLASATASGNASVPVGVVQLYHGAPAYGSFSALVENRTFKYHHSGDPFTFEWANNESDKSTVLVGASTSSTLPSQGWCLTAATPSALYTGSVQIFGAQATSFTTATTLGYVVVEFECLFRARA